MPVALKITGFKGIAPRVAPSLLAEQNGQVAANCRLSAGELYPLREPLVVYSPPVSETLRTLYKADDLWFVWGKDVHVTRSPLPGTVKFIYTGDGEPRITTPTLAFGAGNGVYPEQCRVLGVAKPVTAPTVTPSGGALADVTRFYAYTFYDDWNQESAVSPLSAMTTGKPDGTWAISGMDAAPPNSGDITALTYVGSTVTITTTSTHFNRVGETITLAGVTTVTNVNGTWTLTAVNIASKTMTFTVTTAPSGTYNNATDTTDTWTRQAPFGTCTKRLYRTSGSTAQFQLVAEGITATTYNDTLTDAQIPGDELITASWEMPPSDLGGVITLPSGALCGFSGNEICFSEPLQPHAWPPEYRMRSRFPVVAVEQYSSGVVAGTTGTPLKILGQEPGQMMAQPAEGAYPCLSKRSMVSLGDSVAYATAHGLVAVGDSGTDILTKDWFTRDEWVLLNPSEMKAAVVRGRVYLMTVRDVEELLAFDFLDGTGLTTAYITASALFADTLTGKLYIACSCNDDIREFDPVYGAYMSQDWRSKKMVTTEPVNMGAAKVKFTARYRQDEIDAMQVRHAAQLVVNQTLLASGDIGGQLGWETLGRGSYLGGSNVAPLVLPTLEIPAVTFTLHVDGAAKYSYTTFNSNSFPLPAGYKTDNFEVQVQGRVLIHSVEIAETRMGLKGA